MTNHEALDKVIAKLIDKLDNMEPDSDKYKLLTDTVVKLTEKSNEMKRVEIEAEDKAKTREHVVRNSIIENNLKTQQLNDERIDRWVKNILTAVNIAVTTGLTVWGVFKTFKFEKDGVITTTLGRLFVNRLGGKK